MRSAGLTLAALMLVYAAGASRAHDAPQVTATPVQMHGPDCTCRARGRDFAVGDVVCLRTDQGPRLAQCGMVLNNTSWTISERTCPES